LGLFLTSIDLHSDVRLALWHILFWALAIPFKFAFPLQLKFLALTASTSVDPFPIWALSRIQVFRELEQQRLPFARL
jgi:hypothetical protein